MGQIDSTVVDTVAYGISNVALNDGWNIAFSGIATVFGGLVLIAITILLFNKLLNRKSEPKSVKFEEEIPAAEKTAEKKKKTAINPDHLVAIGVAVELYRRLHLETLESAVTFERGETNSNWKAGPRYGQRKSLR